MTFAGLSNGKQRADVIAYLNTLSAKPVPLPTAQGAGRSGRRPPLRRRLQLPPRTRQLPLRRTRQPPLRHRRRRNTSGALHPQKPCRRPVAPGCEVYFVAAHPGPLAPQLEKADNTPQQEPSINSQGGSGEPPIPADICLLATAARRLPFPDWISAAQARTQSQPQTQHNRRLRPGVTARRCTATQISAGLQTIRLRQCRGAENRRGAAGRLRHVRQFQRGGGRRQRLARCRHQSASTTRSRCHRSTKYRANMGCSPRR